MIICNLFQLDNDRTVCSILIYSFMLLKVQLSLCTKIGITAIINKLLEMYVKQAAKKKHFYYKKLFTMDFPCRASKNSKKCLVKNLLHNRKVTVYVCSISSRVVWVCVELLVLYTPYKPSDEPARHFISHNFLIDQLTQIHNFGIIIAPYDGAAIVVCRALIALRI